MAKIRKISNHSAQHIPSDSLKMLLLILLTICIICGPANADTSIYVFDPNQSTVVQTGGFAGVNETYGIEGKFQLTVDLDAGIASFDKVDANLTEPSGFLYTQSLGVLFNMTGLAGTVIDDKTIEFEGKTADGTESDVRLTLSLSDDSARLTGNIAPPPNSADMFFYDVNAVAIKKYSGGTGEPNDPYQIATAQDLMLLGKTPEDYDKHFILTADIDLDPNLPGRSVFNRAVIAPDTNDVDSGFQGVPFAGVFDGNGCTISYLSCMSKGKSYVALFGYVSGYSAEIKHLGLIDPNISAEQNAFSIGSLTGEILYGTITNCYVEGCNISGENFVGGLVGGNNHGTIRNCYAIGTVSGFEHLGGLAGGNSGWIMNSYVDVSVTGNNTIGGLVGYNAGGRESVGTIQQCYSVGILMGDSEVGGLVGGQSGIVIDSFWDIETSGQIESAIGEGKTTAEMQTASTFLEAGWDFVGETENGTEDIWSICEKTNYPRFVWQIPVGDFVCPDGITIDDFLFFLEHWLDNNCDSSNGYCDGTDLDQSGTVDANDLEIFFENWSAEE